MKCPACHHEDTKVVDSRVAADGFSIRRRRECLSCEFRFSTFEEVEILDLTVIKRDGRKEAYNREKIVAGLRRALEKRPVAEEQLKMLIGAIERDLQALKQDEIDAVIVGDTVLKNLCEVDQIAYIRFASVYKKFDDVATFKDELNKLLK